jgi:hypothetical protein
MAQALAIKEEAHPHLFLTMKPMSGHYSRLQGEVVATGDYKRVPVEPEYRHLIKEQDEKMLRLHPAGTSRQTRRSRIPTDQELLH